MRPLTVFLAAIVVVGSVSAQSPSMPDAYIDFDGYTVISTLLKQRLEREFSKKPDPNKTNFPNPIVIELRAAKGSIREADPKKCFDDKAALNEWSGAFANYAELNKKDWVLQKQLRIEDPYELAATSRFFSDAAHDGWRAFYGAYPHAEGVFDFSVVGFDTDKRHAVVYMGFGCGPLCGDGAFHLFKRRDNTWVEWRGKGRDKWGGCPWVS